MQNGSSLDQTTIGAHELDGAIALSSVAPIHDPSWPHVKKVGLAIFAVLLMSGASYVVVPFLFHRPLSALLTGQILSVHNLTGSVVANEGDKLGFEFAITNVSGAPIKIVGFNATCGCTRASDEFPIALDPGATSKLHLNVKVGQPDDHGEFKRYGRLLVNQNGIVPQLVLSVKVSNSLVSNLN